MTVALAKKIQLPLIATFLVLLPFVSHGKSTVDTLKGQILLQSERGGSAWYTDPVTKRRYTLGTKKRALKVLRSRAVGVGSTVMKKIPRAKDNWDANETVFRTYKGRVILDINNRGVAWYVDPVTRKRYKMKNPKQTAKVIRAVGQPVKNTKLYKFKKGTARGRYVRYTDKKLKTKRGEFRVKILSISREKAQLRTLAANSSDCFVNCSAKSVKNFVEQVEGVAGINATYFSADTGSTTNSFLSPFFNSPVGRLLNEYKMPHHHGPLLIVTTGGQYDYFHRSIDAGWELSDYEERTGRTVAAAVSNYPSLVEGGEVIVGNEILEPSMTNDRIRVGIGYTKDRVYLVTVHDANVTDLAYVFKKLRVRNAMNLDGGTSSALYSVGQYKVGPGRLVPNAIVLK